MEGEDATFSCFVVDPWVRKQAFYSVRGHRHLAGNTTLSYGDSVIQAFVVGPYNDRLILKGLTREFSGYWVRCGALAGSFDEISSNGGGVTVMRT